MDGSKIHDDDDDDDDDDGAASRAGASVTVECHHS